MNPGARLAALFNVQPGEGRPVGLLLAYSFCIGVARIFTLSAGYALFLDSFDAGALPIVYLATTLCVSLGGLAFLRLQERLSQRGLLAVTLGAMVAALLLFRVGLALPGGMALAIGVPIFYDLLWALSNLAFGVLSGRLFTVRQGKRLFSVVEGGQSLAVGIGGLLTPLVGAWIGAADLLQVAAAGALGATVCALAAARLPGVGDDDAEDYAPPAPSRLGDLARQPYVLLILLMSALSGLCYYLLDSIFYYEAGAQFADAAALAGFLGTFYAVGELLGLASRALFSARLLARYGLPLAVLAQPVTVTAAALVTATLGLLPGAALLFWSVAVTKLIDTVIGEDVNRSATLILYQALSGSARLRVQTLVDGGVTPAATGLAGLLLLALEALGGLNTIGRMWLLLALLAPWLLVAVLLGRAYPQALRAALSRRWLGGGAAVPADSASLEVFRQGLASPHPGVAIFALSSLEQRGDSAVATVLPTLLSHPAAEVRRQALERLADLRPPEVLPAVSALAADDPDPATRGAALRALAAIGESGAIPALAPHLEDGSPEDRLGAMVGLLRYGGLEGTLLAAERMAALCASPLAADRALAARALGEIGVRSFYQPLLKLLDDPNLEVRRAALAAAPRVGNPRLWPAVVAAALSLPTRQAALAAVAAGGDEAARAVGEALERPELATLARARLVRALGRAGGLAAVAALERQVAWPATEVRAAAVAALEHLGYVAIGPADAWALREAMAEAMRSAWSVAAAAEVGDEPPFGLLRAALLADAAHSRGRALALLGFRAGGRPLVAARAALAHSSAERRAHATELIDLGLPGELRPLVIPLVEELPEAERVARLRAAIPLAVLGRAARVAAVIRASPGGCSAWTRACALYVAGVAGVTEAAAATRDACFAPEFLIRESAVWSIMRAAGADEPPAGARRGWRMLSTVERVLALKAAPLFTGTPEPVLAELAGLLHEVELPAGAPVFAKGDPGTCMYIIASGRVRVFDGPRTLIELGAGEVVGEMAIIDTEPRNASVEALEDLLLLRLDQGPFYELMEDRFEIARGIIRTLSQRLRHLLATRGDQ